MPAQLTALLLTLLAALLPAAPRSLSDGQLYLPILRYDPQIIILPPSPTPTPTPQPACDAAYPTLCLRPPPPDLDCTDIGARNFPVLPPDPHGLDGDHDGVGCES